MNKKKKNRRFRIVQIHYGVADLFKAQEKRWFGWDALANFNSLEEAEDFLKKEASSFIRVVKEFTVEQKD